jgi:hypothetical protein
MRRTQKLCCHTQLAGAGFDPAYTAHWADCKVLNCLASTCLLAVMRAVGNMHAHFSIYVERGPGTLRQFFV